MGIYANFHKPAWQTLKHRLLTVKITKKLFKKIKELADSGEKDDFKRERMFGRVVKIPIANNPNGLVEMDFVDDGVGRPFCTFGIPFQDSQPSLLWEPGERKSKRRKR